MGGSDNGGLFSVLLSPHKRDRGQQDSQRQEERAARDPERPFNHGVIGPDSVLYGDLQDPPDSRPDDEIVSHGEEKKDRHKPHLHRQVSGHPDGCMIGSPR